MSRIVIVGSGFGGIALAARLLQQRPGRDEIVVLERGDDVGGTWRDNSYPGCACDVQSHLYSLSFAPNPDWTRRYAPQPEIQRYLQDVATRTGVRPLVRCGHTVRAAAWDGARWRVEAEHDGATVTLAADVLVLATGALSEPVIPPLPGLERFAGPAFHSARWDHAAPLDGARVAVIGTGASAVQFVPALAPRVARLHVVQRTPPWVLPRHDRAIPPALRALYRHVPLAQRAVRAGIWATREALLHAPFRDVRRGRLVTWMARRHLARQVADPALRARLTPAYALGCKRVLLSDDWYPALARPNVEVVTAGIREIRPHAIVTADGVERPVDALVLATGFRPTAPPLAPHVTGADGRSLADAWAGSPQAHLGVTVAGFPNLALLLGPNTGLGHSSVLLMIEAQVAHVRGLLDAADARGDARGPATWAPTAAAQAAWLAGVEARMRGTVWIDGGCASWYLDDTGRNSTLWPDGTWAYRRRVARVRPAEYAFAAPAVRREGPPVLTAALR